MAAEKEYDQRAAWASWVVRRLAHHRLNRRQDRAVDGRLSEWLMAPPPAQEPWLAEV